MQQLDQIQGVLYNASKMVVKIIFFGVLSTGCIFNCLHEIGLFINMFPFWKSLSLVWLCGCVVVVQCAFTIGTFTINARIKYTDECVESKFA